MSGEFLDLALQKAHAAMTRAGVDEQRDGRELALAERAELMATEVAGRRGASTYAILGVGTGRVKIGSAGNVDRRGLDLQVASPVELVLIATCARDIERDLHRFLRSEWVHGEWFHLSPKTLRAIDMRMKPAWLSFAHGSLTRGRNRGREIEQALRRATERHEAKRRGRDAFGFFGVGGNR